MEYSRRQFFKVFSRELLKTLLGEVEPILDSSKNSQDNLKIIRPPGARDSDCLIQLCRTCQKECARACPEEAISFLNEEFGLQEGTPFLNPAKKPCRWCRDMPCLEACPTGALTRDERGEVPPIAVAQINLELCATSQGIFCDYCAHYCPPHLKAIRIIQRQPYLDPHRCTGCGMCAYHCDQVPHAISIRAV